jgi:hypothetical protein
LPELPAGAGSGAGRRRRTAAVPPADGAPADDAAGAIVDPTGLDAVLAHVHARLPPEHHAAAEQWLRHAPPGEAWTLAATLIELVALGIELEPPCGAGCAAARRPPPADGAMADAEAARAAAYVRLVLPPEHHAVAEQWLRHAALGEAWPLAHNMVNRVHRGEALAPPPGAAPDLLSAGSRPNTPPNPTEMTWPGAAAASNPPPTTGLPIEQQLAEVEAITRDRALAAIEAGLPEHLRATARRRLDGVRPGEYLDTVERLIRTYQSTGDLGEPPGAPPPADGAMAAAADLPPDLQAALDILLDMTPH